MRIVVLEPCQADLLDLSAGDFASLLSADSAQFEAKGDVANYVRPGKEHEILEDHRTIGPRPFHWLIVDQNRTL